MGKQCAVGKQHHPTFRRQIQTFHERSLALTPQTRNLWNRVGLADAVGIALNPAMRVLANIFLSATAIVLSSCQPMREPPVSQAAAAPSGIPIPAISAPATPVSVTQPQISASTPQLLRKTIAGITFEGVAYDSRTHRLQVVDQSDGPGSLYQSAQDLTLKSTALLAINAGFFTPEGDPLGLVISQGKTSGSWNSASSLGSGIYHETASGDVGIIRRGSRSAVSSSQELLQAGPLLIESGSPVSGLDSQKSAMRSIVMTDGRSRWWIGITSPCSLDALAQALSENSPAPWQIRMALNLDGGRSTDLFVSENVSGGSLNRRGMLNRPVRNFLVLRKK